ncbi:MAG: hypothetical protein QHH14_11490 [Clostridiales bacterium]|jgi:hypothetical protein|nr:hypothetical protein [Clostridiales bacterium]
MANRFFQSWANRRRNPFTDQENPVEKRETGLIIPTSAPYLVQLLEVPLKELPSSVTVYNVTDSQYMTEVTTSPAQGQFRVDYPEPGGEGTGLIEFNSADAGKVINISYKGTGSPVITEFLDAIVEGFEQHEYATAAMKASGNVKNSNDAEKVTVSTTPVKLKEIRINKNYEGSLRVVWLMNCEKGYGVWGQVYKNGTPIGTEQKTTYLNPTAFTQDISGGLAAGDLIQIYLRAASGDTGHVKNMKLAFDWLLTKIMNWILSTPLALSNTDGLDVTNQDP